MKISIIYNFPNEMECNGKSLEEDCTASIHIEELSVLHMRRVLAELSEISVRDFARLGVLTAFKHGNDASDKEIESQIIIDCSKGSGLPDSALYSGVQPLKSHPA